MNIASIDRGIYTTVEVGVGSSLISIETGNSLITFNRSETEQLIQALQQALIKLPEEPKYVVVLPQNMTNTFWKYFFLNSGGAISNSNNPYNVLDEGSMTLDEIKAISEHYEPFTIPAEEFKQNEIGEF
ncbi:hypothetical protein POQMFEI_00081 [Enterococcus phage vB_OCPT_CCS2]|nr:hypothetical protein POQMFEI_00081 [Enterococcus phage vB_OCPT_CCS2]